MRVKTSISSFLTYLTNANFIKKILIMYKYELVIDYFVQLSMFFYQYYLIEQTCILSMSNHYLSNLID